MLAGGNGAVASRVHRRANHRHRAVVLAIACVTGRASLMLRWLRLVLMYGLEVSALVVRVRSLGVEGVAAFKAQVGSADGG